MRVPVSQLEPYSQELLAIEKDLRDNALIYESEVQLHLETANTTYSQRIYDFSTGQLRQILDFYNKDTIRQVDPFRPYGPESLLSQGDLHLLTQMDGVAYYLDPDKFITGLLILGPQNSGKSFFISHLCLSLSSLNPDLRVLLIDPKNGFRNLPGFRHLDLRDISLDLKPPKGINNEDFIYQFIPNLADIMSVIYGLDFLNKAAEISLRSLKEHPDQNLCLKDIYESLCLLKPNSFRERGYYDAAKISFGLILGKQNLFSCRKGLPLDWVYEKSCVINSQMLSNEIQCKAFLYYLLFWIYQFARNLPETQKIKYMIIVDDSTRFVGVGNQFNASKKTSPLGHMLAVLRSSGVCLAFASQIPSHLDPAVLSLSRNVIVIGNINGEDNLKTIQSLMSLTHEQKNAITKFKPRESLAFISGSAWPNPVHGWTLEIAGFPEQEIEAEDCSAMIIPWYPLTDVQKEKSVATKQPTSRFNSNMDKLVYDCIYNPYVKASEHAKKFPSIREYDTAKIKALQDGYLVASQAGKSIFLIPTNKGYKHFNIENPYERAVSPEHSYYVNFTANILKERGLSVKTETPIGSKGATIDVTATDKSGNQIAVEISLSTSNLLSNATKLQDAVAYMKIIWLCKDAATSKAVRSYFNTKADVLPKELLDKFSYEHLSSFKKGGRVCV